MHYKTERLVGKMSIEKFHETLQELEKKASWIQVTVDFLDKQTLQVIIDWR